MKRNSRISLVMGPAIPMLFLLMLSCAVPAHIGHFDYVGPPPIPIEAPLVREGDYAVRLARALELGAGNEAEAQMRLSEMGVGPWSGWISNYPVTPAVLNEIKDSLIRAFASGRFDIAAGNELLGAMRYVNIQFGIDITPAPGDIPPMGWMSVRWYVTPGLISDYYSQSGPPVVTFYSPPDNFSGLYDRVSMPFWYSGYWFSGFYILHDYQRAIAAGG